MNNNEKIINGYTNTLITALNSEYKKTQKKLEKANWQTETLLGSMGFYRDRAYRRKNGCYYTITDMAEYDIENIKALKETIEYLQSLVEEYEENEE